MKLQSIYKKRFNRFVLPSVVSLITVQAASAALVSTSTTLLTNSQASDGVAGVDLTAGSASAVGTSLPGGLTLGDGTVEEFAFVNASGVSDAAAGSLPTYTTLGSSISSFDFPAGTLGGNSAFAEVNDGTTVFTTLTGANASDVSFTVDTSSYTSGTVYVVFGSFQDYAQVSVTDGTTSFVSDILGNQDSGAAFDTTGTAFDFSGVSLANNGTAIAAFDFDNGAGATSLDFRQINTDLDGSRARFYGVAINGVIPEPSSTALLGLGGLALLARRRR